MKKYFYLLTVAISLLLLAACNKDDEGTGGGSMLPRIVLDSETGIYYTKIGKPVKITPTVENDENSIYTWKIDGKVVSTEHAFESVFDEECQVFVTLRVDNREGSDETEVRIDVGQLALPVISFAIPSTGLDLLSGREYTFEPDVQNDENARYEWYLGDSETPVSTDKNYTFVQTELGTYTLLLRAFNEDGQSEKEIQVNVVDAIRVKIDFIPSYYFDNPLDKSVSLGRAIFLRPHVNNAVDPEYSWYVNDELQAGQADRMFVFKPSAEGEYKVVFRVTDTDESAEKSLSRNVTRASAKRITETELKVTCYEREEDRTIITSGQPAAAKVLEFLPAPGQFVNEKGLAGYTNEKTFEEARQYAEKRLKANSFISLGSFGGYVIMGFDHSVENKGNHQGYDFSIAGNQFGGSNEPGIVYVMQDVNGNGEPDDEWYELKGSETGNEWTVQEYALTYYKPSARRQAVKWTDNMGKSGSVAYLEQFHPQDYYYPLWLEDESYTYYGTCLRQNTSKDPDGNWSNNSFAWGYVDNVGSDNLDYPAKTCKTYFKIENAITLDGKPANLRYIDFVKVQTGINGGAGALGENSTEVVGMAYDENL